MTTKRSVHSWSELSFSDYGSYDKINHILFSFVFGTFFVWQKIYLKTIIYIWKCLCFRKCLSSGIFFIRDAHATLSWLWNNSFIILKWLISSLKYCNFFQHMQYFFFFNKLAIIEFLDNLTGKEMEGDSRVTFNIVILSAWMHSPYRPKRRHK